MPPIPGHWHSLIARHVTSIRAAAQKAATVLEKQYFSKPQTSLQTVLARNTPKQPLHPLARIRQHQSRWYSTARHTVRLFTTSAGRKGSSAYSALPKSAVGTSIRQSSGRAPFASSLRPNLTGGTLGRTAGGYTIGGGRVGGARYFSHGPASQAQVVHNVSQAVRAFFTQGNKAQFDGYSERTGSPMFKAVSVKQHQALTAIQQVPQATPGSWVEFPINPTVTALTPLSTVTGYNNLDHQYPAHVNNVGLLNALSADFTRALKDLAVVLNDLRRLATIGDLPITCESTKLKVHFPGCDADTVFAICDELGVQRGTVVQDDAFDSFAGVEMALLFPYAPSRGTSTPSCDSSCYQARPHKAGQTICQPDPVSIQDLLLHDTSDLSTASILSLSETQSVQTHPLFSGAESIGSHENSDGVQDDPSEYQGFEGIYRFIEECNAASRRR